MENAYVNKLQADRVVTRPSDQTSRSEIRSIDPWKHTSEKRLERILSSSLLAGDNDVRQVVLDEVDDISKILKSGALDEQTVRVKLHPAVWGAVRQSLLDRELRLLALTDDLTVFTTGGDFLSPRRSN